jgi:hypothetical protein
MLGRRNRNSRRIRAPVPLCRPQIPHDLTRARTRAVAVGSRPLTAWTAAWPSLTVNLNFKLFSEPWSYILLSYSCILPCHLTLCPFHSAFSP